MMLCVTVPGPAKNNMQLMQKKILIHNKKAYDTVS
jgi:hypothetical protein